jgi:hypothetical protein
VERLCPHSLAMAWMVGGVLDLTSRFNSICGVGASLFWAAGFAGVRHGLIAGFSPADLMIQRYLWSGLALLPFVMRAGISDLNGIGWSRGILLAVLGGPIFAIIGYAGFLLVPLGHGGVIQPSWGTLGGLLLATLVLGEWPRSVYRESPEISYSCLRDLCLLPLARCFGCGALLRCRQPQ